MKSRDRPETNKQTNKQTQTNRGEIDDHNNATQNKHRSDQPDNNKTNIKNEYRDN